MSKTSVLLGFSFSLLGVSVSNASPHILGLSQHCGLRVVAFVTCCLASKRQEAEASGSVRDYVCHVLLVKAETGPDRFKRMKE